MMFIKRNQRFMASFMTFLMIFSLIAGISPASAEHGEMLLSPILDKEGNVIFNADHDGEELFLVGSMNSWDIANPISMEKVGGHFTKSLKLDPGTYQYKYTKGNSWEAGDFTDPLNPLEEDGNSLVHVPGLKLNRINESVETGSQTSLQAEFADEAGNAESVSPDWSLAETVAGVEIDGDTLIVGSDAEAGRIFTIRASFDGFVSEKQLEIVSSLNEYTIHYFRHDQKASDWDMWIWGDGLDGGAYAFQGKTGDFATASYKFPQNEIKLLTRLGNWESQEMERTIKLPEGQGSTEVWIVQGDERVHYSEPEIKDDFQTPAVRFVYERENQDYDGWNIWVWNTGAKNDQIDFEETDTTAVANIEVGPKTQSMGFKLRKGTGWDEVDVDEDRTIQISPTESLTKVFVKEGELEFRTVPFASGPLIDRGEVTFYYRDAALFRLDAMDTIESVKLLIAGQEHEMVYEKENERFSISLDQLGEGTYEYSYLVTKSGNASEMPDPYNIDENGKSLIVLSSLDFKIAADVSPESINHNQHAVISLDIEESEGKEEGSVKEIYVDLTELGGSARTKIDPELNAVTVSVKEHIPAGLKTLPITVIDSFGNSHDGAAEIKIEPRVIEDAGDFDWDEARIYFMLTDRFADGNTANNNQVGHDPANPGSYQGGDFKGVTEKLDYLKDLGINTVWITPIVENVYHDVAYNDPGAPIPYHSYHGYWALDFEELNPHLGTLEEFHELIDAASDRDIKIMVDVVLNHTGYGLKLTDGDVANPPEGYPTNADREKYADMLRQDGGNGDEVTGELSGLPDFITEEAAVREQVINWQVSWLEKSTTAKGNTIDYFRVDTVKHVQDTMLMDFKNELTLSKPDFKMIGEAWGAGANNQYAKRYLDTGMMDSLLDFDFKHIAKDLVNGDIDRVNQRLESRNDSITNTAVLGQFLGSHDEDGFLHFIGDQDESKLMVAAALQITSKGQPVIYYGEELGLSGEANWPYYDNRYMFPWEETEGNHVLAHYQKLLGIRGDYSDVFSKGSYEYLTGSDESGYLVYKRAYDGKTAIVGINTTSEAKNVSLELPVETGTAEDVYNGVSLEVDASGNATVLLPAREDGGNFIIIAEKSREDMGPPSVPENTLRVHYQRDDDNFKNLGLWLWEDVVSPSENWPAGGVKFLEDQRTDYGAYLDIPIKRDAKKVGFLVLDTVTGNKDGEDKIVEFLSPEINEVWIKQGSDEVHLAEPVELPENTVRIHYERADGQYDGWSIWTWGDVEKPADNWPDGASDASGIGKHGAFYDVELKEGAREIGFLFVNKTTGEQSADYSTGMLEYGQLFVIDGDGQVYTNPYGSIPIALLSGELLSDKKMQLRFSTTEGLTETDLLEGLTVTDKGGKEAAIDSVSIIDGRMVELNGAFDLDEIPFTVVYGDRTIQVSGGWRMLDEMYGYEGELGAQLHEDGTATLKVWSPKAENVSVVLYDKDDQFIVAKDGIPMTLGEDGVWEVRLDEGNTGIANVRGYYYHYKITHDGETKLALDPYAKSMAGWANEESGGQYPVGKAAIVDPSAIGPELDFASIQGFEKREDAIIYEVHVRDFTSDPNISDELSARFGTFASFVEKLDYIEELGVTHIQLLPVMSYFYADEWANDERILDWSSSGNNYNWGYDPMGYFSLTGMYSENPDDPELRIEEFKRLVDEIHKRDMGIILDVVYNHTARVSIFEDLVPNYYHFMDVDGTPRESFGGGRLGTTHEMSRKLLVDSVAYWVDEYKVDGFRFDMMGDHDAETIQLAYDKAKELNPNIVMIGEGWRTYAGDEGDSVMAADQDWMQHTESVGVFSDEFRNELKSGFGSEGEPRFLTGGARNIEQIFDNVTANPHNFIADDPGDVVPYIEAHDNLTLHDVIAQSIKKDPDFHEEEIHQRIRLGNAMVLTSQGTAFIHAGQEYGRTKQFRTETETAPYKSTYMTDADGNPFNYPYFIHDSYDSSDLINRFDWEMALDDEQYPIQNMTREYTEGLIELRRSTDAFTLATMEDISENVSLIDAPEIAEQDLVIGFSAFSSDGSEGYYVFINADEEKRVLTLEDESISEGTVIVDNDEAGTTEVSDPTGFEMEDNQITLDPLTSVIVKIADVQETPEPPEHPEEPENPDLPGNPGDPGNPEEPQNPGGPGNPETPVPGDPGEAETPPDTDGPDGDPIPANPGKTPTPDPKKPGEPQSPLRPGKDGGESRNGGTEKPREAKKSGSMPNDGAKLPDTATATYQWLLAGVLLLLAGTISYWLQRRRVK